MAAIRQISKFASCDATVLLNGETGTGKEMFARAIHYLSPRAANPFIPVNCGAIPAELVENELFGHEPGAFTGAAAATRGLIAEAEGGTLFLDEIDTLPLQTQVKLLRFLQDYSYRPLGARKLCGANIRIIAASNAKLENAMRAGRFRADLLYRINALSLTLPPLRERRQDIPLLARHFAAECARGMKLPAKEISPAALRKLMSYYWPGNVRELQNIIQRAMVLVEDNVIRPMDIALPGQAKLMEAESFKTLKARVVEDFERSYLQELLAEHDGNITRAARAADKNRRALWELLRKHQIHLALTEPERNPHLDKPRLH
jgi:DNA-binding NtrC family response regulator